MQKSAYTIIITFVILSIIGFVLLPHLSVQLKPSRSSGNINISYFWGNVSPEVMEQRVTSKLEGAFSTLQGIKKVSSFSSYGSASITLELDRNANTDQLRFEVSMLVRQLYPQLPKELSYPIIRLNSPDQEQLQKPFMILQLNGHTSASELQEYAEEKLKPKLAQNAGIYEIDINGGNLMEWVLTYDQDQLSALNISEKNIIVSIQRHFQESSIGIGLLSNGNQMNVSIAPEYKMSDKSTSLEIWKNIPVKKSGERIVYLTDLVEIERKEKQATLFYRINGKNAVNLIISTRTGVNQITLADEIKNQIQDKSFKRGFEISIEYDSTEFIKENLQKIYFQTGVAILILLIFVIITSRSFIYTLLILVGLISNLALSFIIFYFLKVEIHLYSLAAITTSLGIIIDNTIVMIDHYKRYRNLQVFTALLGATLTTIAGLSIIYFLPEQTKLDLIDFAVVMIITLLVSLLIALFFIPALMEKINLTPEKKVSNLKIKKLRLIYKFSNLYSRVLKALIKYKKLAFLFAILTFGLPVFILPNKLEGEGFWVENYNKTWGNEWYIENFQPIINKTLGGSLRLFVNYVFEKSYFAKPERTALYIQVGLPNQCTIEQMNDIFLRFEVELAKYNEIDRFISNIYNGQNGHMVIYFKQEHDKGSFPYILKSKLIGLSTEMSGINWDIYGVGQGFSQNLEENSNPTFNVLMYGYNYNELERQALILKEKLEKHPRIQEVDINKSPDVWDRKSLFEYVLETKQDQLALKKMSKIDVFEYLERQNINLYPDINQIINGEYQQIKIVPKQIKNFDIWQLHNQPVKIENEQMKLADFTSITKQKVTPDIIKENQQYLRLVSFEYSGISTFGENFLDKTLEEMKSILPLGYTTKRQELNWGHQEAMQQYGLLVLVILLIYIICAIIFESLTQPLALILLIPLSFIGVFLSFYWFDFNFDQGGYASFVLLSGNVVCAAIFIIAEFNNLKKLHPKISEFNLYLNAFNHKIVPILLTVLSTVAGLIPFLMYGEGEAFWFALGVGTIGGLIMSLFAIIFYLPLFLLNHDSIAVKQAKIR